MGFRRQPCKVSFAEAFSAQVARMVSQVVFCLNGRLLDVHSPSLMNERQKSRRIPIVFCRCVFTMALGLSRFRVIL